MSASIRADRNLVFQSAACVSLENMSISQSVLARLACDTFERHLIHHVPSAGDLG